MLTANEIKIQREYGNIKIDPWDPWCLGPNSYDVHLHNELLVYRDYILDTRADNRVERVVIPDTGLELEPGKLYLGRTVEYTETKNLVPMYEGRSSMARLGVLSHISAGFGDIGFRGCWTLEIVNLNGWKKVKVYPWMRIGQLYWHRPEGYISKEYEGKYQDSGDVMSSQMWRDRENGH